MKKIFFILVLLSARMGFAQTALTNTGILYISGGSDILYAGSDFTNNAGAALTNRGQLHLWGNLTNNEVSMAIGTGTLFLNGGGGQIVNGAQPFRTFNFVSNNSGGITLNTNLSVSGAHTFSGGVITTSATPNYLVYEAGSSYSGDGDTKHVNGWVKKFGSTNFIFPVGNGTVERTVALNSISVSSEFNVTYLPNTPNRYSRQIPLRDVDAFEYWPITRVSGGTATVTLNWDSSKVYFPNYIIPDLVVAGWNGTLWTDNGVVGTASGTVGTTGTITSSSISTFNLFTFGSRSWVLPLNLLSFTATRQDNYTKVEWKTAQENAVSHYVVERSDDGSSFYRIAQVNARNSGNSEEYQTNDNSPIHAIAYYRLRAVDIDGKEKLSRIVAVTDGQTSDKLLLLTNPVRNNITLLATGQLAGEFQYQIMLINGQVVQKGELSIQNGGRYDIPLNGNMKQGTYSLRVINNKQVFYYKLLVL